MAAFWMCKLSPTEVARSDAFPGKGPMGSRGFSRGKVSSVAHFKSRQRRLRVLVIDDEPDPSDDLFRLVRRCGHAVHRACDEIAALRAAAAQPPDVVLLDLEIPRLDCFQVARQLRKGSSKEDLFIIGIADRADEDRCRQCTAAGIDLVLQRPVDASVMETLLLLECLRVNRPRSVSTPRLLRTCRGTGGSPC